MEPTGRAVRALVLATAVVAAAACTSARFDGPDGDRRFFEARCGVCHVPPVRESRAVSEWPRILDEMAPRAGLTAPQRERVLTWLTSR